MKGEEREAILSRFGKVPAFFIENKGQTAEEAKYYFKGNDNVYFTDEGVVFQKTVRSQESGVEESRIKTHDSPPSTRNSQPSTH